VIFGNGVLLCFWYFGFVYCILCNFFYFFFPWDCHDWNWNWIGIGWVRNNWLVCVFSNSSLAMGLLFVFVFYLRGSGWKYHGAVHCTRGDLNLQKKIIKWKKVKNYLSTLFPLHFSFAVWVFLYAISTMHEPMCVAHSLCTYCTSTAACETKGVLPRYSHVFRHGRTGLTMESWSSSKL